MHTQNLIHALIRELKVPCMDEWINSIWAIFIQDSIIQK
jgi:hypothetical protein